MCSSLGVCVAADTHADDTVDDEDEDGDHDDQDGR